MLKRNLAVGALVGVLMVAGLPIAAHAAGDADINCGRTVCGNLI